MLRNRKPLKRKSPLRARTRLKPRGKTKYARRPRDHAYMAWVKSLPCVGPFPHQCQGPSEAHHAGVRGLGQRAEDSTAIPLCRNAHHAWHSGGEAFAGWQNWERRTWADIMIREMQALYASQQRREAA